MKSLIAAFIALTVTLLLYSSQAQTGLSDTTQRADTAGSAKTGRGSPSTPASGSITSSPPDDEFNVFLWGLGTAFVCIVIGATLAGSLIATLFLLSVFLLVSAGVLSVGVLVGFYRRSVAAGFRTVLMIACIGGGMLCGAIAFWLINRIFDIHLLPLTALLTGALSGLVGGLLLGITLFSIIRLFLNYCKKRMAF